MKKNLTLVLLIFAACTVSLNAQITLYKGIQSGQSDADLRTYLLGNYQFTHHVFTDEMDYFMTTISGKDYILRTYYNKYEELYAIGFESDSCYESVYSPDLKANVEELLQLLRLRYGAEVYDAWAELSELPDNGEKLIYTFGANPDIAGITVVKNFDDTYSVEVIFEDLPLELLDDSGDTSSGTDDSDDSDDWF